MKEFPASDQISLAISYEPNPLFTIRIDKQKCLLLIYSLFVILVLFEPDYFTTTPLHRIFQVTKCIAALLTIVIFVNQKINLNALIIGTTVFEIWLLFSTVVNHSAIDIWIKNCAYVIVLILFAQTVLEMDAHILPLALSIVLGLYTHINTICRLLFPAGMYISRTGKLNCWLLGYDNCACLMILLSIIIALFRILYYRNHFMIWEWSVLISGLWFIFSQGVATTIIAIVLFFIFLVVSKNKIIRKCFSKGTLIVFSMLLLFFLLQFVSIQDRSVFSFIFDSLGKNTTFTGRTRVWAVAWEEIKSGGWILGMGLQSMDMYSRLFGGRSWITVHNYYLQIIFEGGFVAFVIFFTVLIYTAIRFDRGKYSYAYMPLLAGLLAMMMMWQAEAYEDLVKYGFVLLSLMYNAETFVSDEETLQISHIQLKFRRD